MKIVAFLITSRGGGGTRITSGLEGEGGEYPSLYLSHLNIKKEARVLTGMVCAYKTEKPQIRVPSNS